MYTPNSVPTAPTDIPSYLPGELRAIANAFTSQQPFANLQTLNVAPSKPREGMIIKADGTNWNPGSGAGFYGYVGGVWVFFGGSSASGPAFSLYSTITVNITTFGGIDTKVPLDSASFDTASGLDAANNRWVCPLAGYYQINGNIYLQANSTGYTGAYISIWVNGSRVRVGQYVKYPGVTGTNEQIFNGSWVIYLAAGDYLEMFCTTFLTGGGIVLATFINSAGQYTTLDGVWVRA